MYWYHGIQTSNIWPVIHYSSWNVGDQKGGMYLAFWIIGNEYFLWAEEMGLLIISIAHVYSTDGLKYFTEVYPGNGLVKWGFMDYSIQLIIILHNHDIRKLM